MVTADDIAKVHTFDELVSLLRDKLEWPIPDDYGFEDVVYEYEPKELGLKPDETAKIREIHQLRPLVTNQPWGIFFVSFEEKSIPVVVLRRILRALVVKKRADPKTADRAAWGRHDLLFISAFGNGGARELSFAHFADGAETNDLPVLKVLGWNSLDAQLHNAYVASMLAQRLHWPEDTDDVRAWRETWAGAFELGLNQVVRTSKELSVALAALASNIRARANQLLAAEAEGGPMRQLLKAFRESLIEGLTEDDFADMFAQTISYGLLAARISRPAGLMADNLADMIPATNPFLKDLFETFLKLGGRDKRADMDFDELGVRDVVDMLNRANMEAVLRDFGDRNPKEDPVIHFYELFLTEYDPEKRIQRGVFYTPRPVVNFIVRGVDEVLRTEFGLPLGLADTTTWEELAARNDEIIIPAHVDPKAPFVQILDFAVGTGTFLVEAIELIHTRMVETWKSEGRRDKEIATAWNEYVPKHLLSRLTGYELMMAPYAIAHMKVGLKLLETGYRFGSDERARIFLTNALEPARDLDMALAFMSEALAHEALAANKAKSCDAFTVIVGNPPYSVNSANKNSPIDAELATYKRNLEGERNLKPLNDDYVKFVRLAHILLCRSGRGVAGVITNHSYSTERLFRSMRRALLDDFRIRLLDLRGDAGRDPRLADDENVFGIQQGVAITFLQSSGENVEGSEVSILEVTGSQERKYEELSRLTLRRGAWVQIRPAPPLWVLRNLNEVFAREYSHFLPVNDVFLTGNVGYQTHRDEFVIDFDRGDLATRLNAFRDAKADASYLETTFGIRSNRDWSVLSAQHKLKSHSSMDDLIRTTLYRPFDERFISYSSILIDYDRAELMRHMTDANIGLLVSKVHDEHEFTSVFVTRHITESKAADRTRGCHLFPFRVKRNDLTGEVGWGLNLAPAAIEWFKPAIPPNSDGSQDAVIFDYVYALLHSPGYRARYGESLRSGFPSVPRPNSPDLLMLLGKLGDALIAFHLFEEKQATALKNPVVRIAGTGEARVTRSYPKFDNGKVMINASRWFEDVPLETWEFHVGGYQVCEKWLKDRGATGGKTPKPGRVLSDEDILHYRRIVVALTETRLIMAEIDSVIDAHGGWPGAFVVGETASANETAAAD